MKTAEGLGAYLDARRAEVEAALATFLPSPPEVPAVVDAAMRYSLLAGGKRLRPILCLASADAVGGDRSLALPAACAIELIHTYSLIHDDLPAMDNDTMRRGRPTLHVVARAPASRDSLVTARKLRVIETVAHAAGAVGMVGGQAIDLASVTPDPKGQLHPVVDAPSLRTMHARKTGALIRASAVSGAIMGGGTDQQIAGIDAAAGEFGLAFQIVDDILDVEGVAANLGKSTGKDAAAGKPTYPALYGLEGSRRMAAECLERADASLRSAGVDDERLIAIGKWIVHRSN